MRIETPHRELPIDSRSRVDVERAAPPIAALTPPWEDVAGARRRDRFARRPIRRPSRSIRAASRRCSTPATDYARAELPRRAGRSTRPPSTSPAASRPISPTNSRATEVTTSPAEAFARKRGVCQDFAHVMIAGLRGLGLPALYVSGYIRTIPPPGKPRLAGADASHAWVALWCGPAFGWLGLDPTNAIAEGDDHIVVARGRDYADVPPVEGLILSSGGHDLEVEVDVIPV